MKELREQKAFITGAAQGLGRGIAEALLEKEVTVFVADVNMDKGSATEIELKQKYGKDKVFFTQCDVTNKEQFEATVETAIQSLGQIDIFINNAGIMHEGEGMWEKSVLINYTAMVRGTKLALEHMRKDRGGKGGRIVNIGSIESQRDNYFNPIYAGTKHAIRSFTSGMAIRPDLDELGVEFALLCPDAINTELVANICSENMNFYNDELRARLDLIQLEVPYVAEACLDLLRLDKMNGAILLVTKNSKTYRKMESVEVNPPSTHT